MKNVFHNTDCIILTQIWNSEVIMEMYICNSVSGL